MSDYHNTDPLGAQPGPEQDYQTVVGLLSAYSALALRLGEMQQVFDASLLTLAETVRVEHAELQERAAALEQEMEDIIRRHPEWFAKRKSIVTPSGVIKLTASTKLDVADEQLSVALVRKHYPPAIADALYLRIETSLNLEALEALSDRVLARLKIRRVKGELFSVTPAKVNLGKAVKAAAAKGGK